MRCKIHPDQPLIPAIKVPFKTCLVYTDERQRPKRWEYACPICREAHYEACQKEYGHKFPSE